jgi:hypothetical protein
VEKQYSLVKDHHDFQILDEKPPETNFLLQHVIDQLLHLRFGFVDALDHYISFFTSFVLALIKSRRLSFPLIYSLPPEFSPSTTSRLQNLANFSTKKLLQKMVLQLLYSRIV